MTNSFYLFAKKREEMNYNKIENEIVFFTTQDHRVHKT